VNVETEILDNCQARLTVTVEAERIQREMQNAAKRIARMVSIPGFRKGKVPYQIIVQRFGEESILEEAIEPIGQEAYRQALENSDLKPYAPGILEDYDRDPFVLRFTVPLMPEVDLAGYREVRIPYEEEAVDDDAVTEALEQIREQHATMNPVERPLEMEDVALLDIVGTLDREVDEEGANNTWLARKGVRVKISEDSTYPVPGFPAQVVGMSKGDRREFDMSFAEDADVAEALRGKTLHFDVTCDETFEYSVPELDDDLAKDAGDYETLDDLRRAVREQLEENAARAARNAYYDQAINHLLDEVVSVKYPPIMLEEQIDDMVKDFERTLQQSGLNLEEYKKLRQVTDEQIRADMREEAERQLKRGLVIGQIASTEGLKVSDDEVEDQIQTMALSFGTDAAMALQFFNSEEMRRSIINQLLAEKAIDRLVLIARGEAPEPGSEVEAQESSDASEDEGTAKQDAQDAQAAHATEDDTPTAPDDSSGANAAQ